jgi:hypothetical protein
MLIISPKNSMVNEERGAKAPVGVTLAEVGELPTGSYFSTTNNLRNHQRRLSFLSCVLFPSLVNKERKDNQYSLHSSNHVIPINQICIAVRFLAG